MQTFSKPKLSNKYNLIGGGMIDGSAKKASEGLPQISEQHLSTRDLHNYSQTKSAVLLQQSRQSYENLRNLELEPRNEFYN